MAKVSLQASQDSLQYQNISAKQDNQAYFYVSIYQVTSIYKSKANYNRVIERQKKCHENIDHMYNLRIQIMHKNHMLDQWVLWCKDIQHYHDHYFNTM